MKKVPSNAAVDNFSLPMYLFLGLSAGKKTKIDLDIDKYIY